MNVSYVANIGLTKRLKNTSKKHVARLNVFIKVPFGTLKEMRKCIKDNVKPLTLFNFKNLQVSKIICNFAKELINK